MTRRTTTRPITTSALARVAAPTAALALLLGACGDSEAQSGPADDETPAAGEESPAAEAGTSGLGVEDAWIGTAEEGEMTAAYGVLSNDTEDDITIVAASSETSPMMELHETVMDDSGAMLMQEIDGGMVIPAGETRTLEPGGDHLMFMGLDVPVLAGEEVEVTLELADGSTVPMLASARDHAGGEENYVGGDGHEMGDTDGMTDDHEGHGDREDHEDEGGHGEHTATPDNG